MGDKEIEQKAKRLKTLKNKQEELQAEIDQIEADLKADLEHRGVEELHAGPFTVIWKMIHSSRFDTRTFREKYGKLYKEFTVPSDYRKFSVV